VFHIGSNKGSGMGTIVTNIMDLRSPRRGCRTLLLASKVAASISRQAEIIILLSKLGDRLVPCKQKQDMRHSLGTTLVEASIICKVVAKLEMEVLAKNQRSS